MSFSISDVISFDLFLLTRKIFPLEILNILMFSMITSKKAFRKTKFQTTNELVRCLRQIKSFLFSDQTFRLLLVTRCLTNQWTKCPILLFDFKNSREKKIYFLHSIVKVCCHSELVDNLMAFTSAQICSMFH